MIKNAWYVGCATSQLDCNPLASRIGDKNIVLFRDSNGTAHALLDRCCHRGFPLSKGKITDGNLACGYHGWQYNGSGQCVKISSQSPEKAIPRSHCVANFRCFEQDGYVWVWNGEGEPTDAPSIPEFSSGKWIQGSRLIKCNFLRALEITYDSAHVYFVHPTHPSTVAAAKYGMAEQEGELRTTETGCVVFSPPTKAESDPVPSHAFKMEFKLPGWIQFDMPMPNGVSYMHFFTTPIEDGLCRMDWLLTNPESSAAHVLWTGEGREIIGEDEYVLELVQKSYEREGDKFERSVEADIPGLTVRKILKAVELGARAQNWDIPKRRTFSMMGPARYF